LILATKEAPIPAYFFATTIGTIFLISNVTKSFPVDVAIISSTVTAYFSNSFTLAYFPVPSPP